MWIYISVGRTHSNLIMDRLKSIGCNIKKVVTSRKFAVGVVVVCFFLILIAAVTTYSNNYRIIKIGENLEKLAAAYSGDSAKATAAIGVIGANYEAENFSVDKLSQIPTIWHDDAYRRKLKPMYTDADAARDAAKVKAKQWSTTGSIEEQFYPMNQNYAENEVDLIRDDTHELNDAVLNSAVSSDVRQNHDAYLKDTMGSIQIPGASHQVVLDHFTPPVPWQGLRRNSLFAQPGAASDSRTVQSETAEQVAEYQREGNNYLL